MVVRKGMIFGIDGVLLKQKNQTQTGFKRYHERKLNMKRNGS